MKSSSAIVRIALAMALVSAIIVAAQAVVVPHKPVETKTAPLADYIDDRGIPLYAKNANGTIRQEGHLDIARFYRDILKIKGDETILQKCVNEPQFRACLNREYQDRPGLQQEYELNMQHISDAVDFAQQYGIDYRSTPFVEDFLDE